MSTSDMKKLDFNLQRAYRAYLERGASKDIPAGMTVGLDFEGDLADIESLGFETFYVCGNVARGVVMFIDIPKLAAHPGVCRIFIGNKRSFSLDSAVEQIRARARNPSAVGSQGLWCYGDEGIVLPRNYTGREVIVAVIDTGVDYTHPAFLRNLLPADSRILYIWDQGLVPRRGEAPPDTSLIQSGSGRWTYGVEYEKTNIEQAINTRQFLQHRDCHGHGTAVTSIAAGGYCVPPGGDSRLIGVAPEADIIVVKYMHVPEPIYYLNVRGLRSDVIVDPDQRFMDAVLYCLRRAASLRKPIVINVSLTGYYGPGDGLDDQAKIIDQLLDPAYVGTPSEVGRSRFPRGAIIVQSVGNEGGTKPPFETTRQRQSAKFTVSGELIVPIRLRDTRNAFSYQRVNCSESQQFHPIIGVIFWYMNSPPTRSLSPDTVNPVLFAVKVPNARDFTRGYAIGDSENLVLNVRRGCSSHDYRMNISHDDIAPVQYPSPSGRGKYIHRKTAKILFYPRHDDRGDYSYLTGIYEVKISAPQHVIIYALCIQEYCANGQGVTCEIADEMQDDDHHLADAVTNGLTSESSAVDTGGRYTIAVAAYEDVTRQISSFSSRGPLRNYSSPDNLPPIAMRPNIAAPGVSISAAEGVDSVPILPEGRSSAWPRGIFSGTSVSAPMVTGVIALMLDKNPNLNTMQVLAALSARPGTLGPAAPGPETPEYRNAFGLGMIDALESYNATPPP